MNSYNECETATPDMNESTESTVYESPRNSKPHSATQPEGKGLLAGATPLFKPAY